MKTQYRVVVQNQTGGWQTHSIHRDLLKARAMFSALVEHRYSAKLAEECGSNVTILFWRFW